jgi:hypothetical protein
MTESVTPVTTPPEGDAAAQVPPWGTSEQFDAEKAWNLIQGLRADNKRLGARPMLTQEQEQQLREYQTLIEASKSDLERANESLSKWQTEAEQWRTQAVASRIEAHAAPLFEYPADAVTKLDPAKYLGAGGVIDDKQIQADLAQLLTERPTWARIQPTTTTQPRVPAPNPAQGAGGGAAADPANALAAILQGQLNGSR